MVNAEDQSLGTVTVTVCEVPAGLFEELEGEARDIAEEIREKNRMISLRRRAIFSFEDILATGKYPDGSEFKGNPSELAAQIAENTAFVSTLKESRRALREAQSRKQLEIIAWSVCDHQAEDFLDGEAPQAFEATSGNYDGVNYRIAGPNTILQYASVGRAFIESLYLAVTNYQRQVLIEPKAIWEQAAKTKAMIERSLEKIMQAQVDRSVEVATGPKEDQAAELGEELEGETDPNAKRPPAKAKATA